MTEAFNTLLRSGSLPGAVVFAVALMFGHGLVLANWEFTRWGMTVNEVERASRHSAIKNGQGYGWKGFFQFRPGPVIRFPISSL